MIRPQPSLSVNIDHVATLRQARRTYEPDPVWAAVEAQLGGAGGVTVHLREDRRHIQDHDVERIQQTCHVALNLEMAATQEMVGIALRRKPDMAMLVPEGRMEITTEGGLDVAGQKSKLQEIVAALGGAEILTSAFIDPDPRQVAAAAECGFAVCEVHTGPYAHAYHDAKGNFSSPALQQGWEAVAETGRLIREAGMAFNAGHALNYVNVGPIAALEGLRELHIGHAIVSRAIFVGLRKAVGEMTRLIHQAADRPFNQEVHE